MATFDGDLFGRRALYAVPPVDEAIDDKFISKALAGKLMEQHLENAQEIDYIYWYLRGDQPVLERTKEIRSEINNIILENRAREVVEFKKGYEFAKTPIYVNVGHKDTSYVELLNSYDRADHKETKDQEMCEWIYSSGNAYKICMGNEEFSESDDVAPYITNTLDPRNTFVVYSSDVWGKPLFAGTISHTTAKESKSDGGDEGGYYDLTVYTASNVYAWKLEADEDNFFEGFSGEIPATADETEINGLGMIPIVEYILNDKRVGYIDLCFHLFNAINTIDSDRVDALAQFVQSYLVFLNADFEKDEDGEDVAPRVGDAISLRGENADVKFITAVLDQMNTQTLKDDLLKAIYEICGVPSRQERSTGADTGKAAEIRTGRPTAEDRALATEKYVKRSELELTKLKLRICRDMQGVDIGDLTVLDLDMIHSRNRSENMYLKAQTLALLLQCNAEIEDAFNVCDLFPDATAAAERARARIEEQTAKELEALDMFEPAISDEVEIPDPEAETPIEEESVLGVE